MLENNKYLGALSFIIGLVEFFLSALVIKLVWGWFIVPLGAVSLSYALSLGIVVIIAWLFGGIISVLLAGKSNGEKLALQINSLIGDLLFLLIGFIVSLFL